MPDDPIERLNVDLEVFGIPQSPGVPPVTETYLHVRRRQDGAAGTAVLGLPAYTGATGPAGPPGLVHQGDRTTAQLATLAGTLTTANLNWTYRNSDNNDMHVWDGDSFVVYPDAFGAEGPAGPAPTLLDGTVKYDGVIVSGASLDVTGSNPYQISIDLPDPTGPAGPTGPPGPLLSSTDITGTPTDGQILEYDTTTSKMVWVSQPGAIEEYVVPPSGFPTTSLSAATTRQQLVSALIPAKSYNYRMDFAGGVDVSSTVGHMIDIEIRTANAVSGPLVGYGRGADGFGGWRHVPLRAHSDVAIQPGSTEAVVTAGNAVTVYASAVKVAGSTDGWSVRSNFAQLKIRLTRVA